MAEKLEGRAREIVDDKNFAHVSIPRPDGTIQTVVVWANTDDQGRVLVNSAEGRRWPANLRRAGQATISVANAENPYEYVSITGKLVEDTHEGADAHIDALAKKYMDADSYPFRREGEQRISFALQPERVTLAGG
jgi:PPOX class probable F420-dependent enzyme